ncbi:Uncharacterised protein [Klebsiella pneumoniae subsp. pneumoniae]|jgi:hypothetical protein|nr:hypothetical protein ABW12_00235 [Pluralibacter gergoviae]STV23046.1 Uncharacterised protein [Klebsiella pneumoniae subsp. pneumoniae]
MTHGVTLILCLTVGHLVEVVMEKAKDMYQRKVRFPEDVRKAIERSGEEQCRQFNTELIYQLRKAYGLIGVKNAQP